MYWSLSIYGMFSWDRILNITSVLFFSFIKDSNTTDIISPLPSISTMFSVDTIFLSFLWYFLFYWLFHCLLCSLLKFYFSIFSLGNLIIYSSILRQFCLLSYILLPSSNSSFIYLQYFWVFVLFSNFCFKVILIL